MTEIWRGRYRPLDTVAQGGQGRLLRGVDRQHDRPVALKVRRVSSSDQRNQVLAEARVLLSLRPHPGLPTVREDFFEGDNYVLVMDWVDGTSLDNVVATRGAPGMPLPTVLRWADQLAAAIDHLHAHRPVIVHGDVKPANVVLTPDNRVVLVDFGIASNGAKSRSGTAGYVAPEVLDGQAPSAAADIYGLAATLLAVLTGRPPGEVRPPWEGVDPVTVEVIERALRPGLSLEPERRPGSAHELVERMRAWASGSSLSPTSLDDEKPAVAENSRSASRSRASRWLRAAGVVALIGVILGALALSRGGGANLDAPVLRLEGPDRYATSAQVALATFDHSDVAVLARGDDLADAVAASYLAGADRGPILLTPPDALPNDVLAALKKLEVNQVFLIGDTTAISGTVDASLQENGMRATRLAGVSRYATAGVIAQASGQPGAMPGFGPTALLVNGADTADAVAVGPIAYAGHFPLLYTNSTSLPDPTLVALKESGVTHAVVVGSADQVSDAVVAALTAAGISSQRVAGGGDPASDSVAVATFAQQALHWKPDRITLVRGDQGAVDGVSAIANAGARGGALLLTNSPDKLATAVTAFLGKQAGEVRQFVVVGDLATITADVERDARAALKLGG